MSLETKRPADLRRPPTLPAGGAVARIERARAIREVQLEMQRDGNTLPTTAQQVRIDRAGRE